jgi:hypothetical protein
MPHPRTVMTLPIAAAAALALSAPPATAAPVGAVSHSGAATITPSPLLDLPLTGTCPSLPQKAVLGLQWLNWMWAPLTLDYASGDVLPVLLVPRTMTLEGEGWRARHDLVPGVLYTAPGPQPADQTTCTFAASTPDGAIEVTITGVLVTVSKRIDALLPPIKV